MPYTTALAQWSGSQCVLSSRQTSRVQPQSIARRALSHTHQTTFRSAHLRQHRTHATGTEVTDEELSTGGNQARRSEMLEEKDAEDVAEQEVAEERIEEGIAMAAQDGTEQQGPKKFRGAPPAQFGLNFLWLDKNVAVAVDQLFDEDKRSPVTEYFFWPRKDAWEELKDALEARPWIQERDKILLLNKTTEIINFWQESDIKRPVEDARAAFPDCRFQGNTTPGPADEEEDKDKEQPVVTASYDDGNLMEEEEPLPAGV